MPKVKANKTFKSQSVLQDFCKEFMNSPNNDLFCNLCNKRFVGKSHQNMSHHQTTFGSKSELPIPHAS